MNTEIVAGKEELDLLVELMSPTNKKDALAKKRKLIINMFREHGWEVNKDYIGHCSNDDGDWFGSTYLISADKSLALTIKKQVFSVHDAKRSYCKVLSIKINDITVTKQGIKSGHLLFLWENE